MSLYRTGAFLKEAYMTKKNTELETGKTKIVDNVYATIISMTALILKEFIYEFYPNDGVNHLLDVKMPMKV